MVINFKSGVVGASLILISACQSPSQKPLLQKPAAQYATKQQLELEETADQKPLQLNTPRQKNDEVIAKLIVYFSEAIEFSQTRLADEVIAVENRYQTHTDPETRLKLAYLLGLTVSNHSNSDKALKLLSELKVEKAVHADYKTLANFLSHNIQKSRTHLDNLRSEQQRRKALQTQLDALTDIETKINEREPIPNSKLESPTP